MTAAYHSTNDVVAFLISKGARIDSGLLHYALKANNVGLWTILLSQKGKVLQSLMRKQSKVHFDDRRHFSKSSYDEEDSDIEEDQPRSKSCPKGSR